MNGQSRAQKKWAYDLPTIDADLEIRFDWQVDVRQAAGSLTGLGVMELQPRSPRTLYEVADTVRKIEDLLCLLTDRDRSLGWPQVKRQGDNDWSRFYHYSRSRRGQAEIEIYENWAPFSWIEAQFGSIADSWFAKHKVFAPTFNNYLATRRGSTLYLEHQFASLVWAMEAMSRISDKPTKDRKLCEKIKLLQENIRSHLSSDDRNRLKRALRYAPEPSLEDRLFEMFRGVPLGLHVQELRAFAKGCANRRHDLSHYAGRRQNTDPSAASDAEFINDLIRFTPALDILCHAKILQEIGIPEEILGRPFQLPQRRSLLSDAGLQLPDLPPPEAKPTLGSAGGC